MMQSSIYVKGHSGYYWVVFLFSSWYC